MDNVSFITKILDYFAKPVNYSVLVSVFLISLVLYSLNLLPKEILINLKIANFLDDFSFIIFLILVSTFFLILVQSIYYISMKINKKIEMRRFKKKRNEIFEDKDCVKLLEEMYRVHPRSINYPTDNYCIKILSQYHFIVLASRSGYMDFSGKEIFPYILQPETVKMIKRRLENQEIQ
ncbi:MULTISPECIES: super-infection exclusion protein B [Staphylococcaceae]|uniref:Superinfection exclusion protein B n=1 Tax=Staphylococcus saprophyticus TaxID=29385 RepID=A0A380HS66_STASA|nr:MULTISPECIES: super-infection exclusion protein B [Staphylococcaceae]MCC4221797.1 super-infection exclusion protein B [Staphylococcus saprophyticus]SUM84962.1 Uncharacterised protein [Staphylococcus saprophyticus]